MWKIVVGFIVFAALAMFVIIKGGDKLDMGGEKHGEEAIHVPAAAPAAAPTAPASFAPSAAASAPAVAASGALANTPVAPASDAK